ncbi:MAG: histidinol-phosphate transaminase [Candidatus Bathyarchaeota archaeon]|nr:histidinol-phosphate transaminase [Candidatus Bathyarchaeota archaeon]
MNIDKIVPKEVKNIICYEVKTIEDRKSSEQIVKMDFNENFAAPADVIQKIVVEACKDVDVRAYPPPKGGLAVKAIADFVGFSDCEVSVANGADEIMDLLMKAFVRKGTKVLVAEPSFPMYTFFAELYGGTKVSAFLEPDFSLNVNNLLSKADKKTSLLFVCSPNNPTANQFPESDIKKLLNEFNGLVVVDEAYADFASGSVLNLVKDYDNLVVLRSFSKAFGLAGVRLGYLVADKQVVNYVQKVTGPFNVNVLTQRIVALALQQWSVFKERIDHVKQERDWLLSKLKELKGITVFPSDANFLLFKVTKDNLTSATVKQRLETRNVLVKDRGHLPLLENCIRVTVGTRSMNQAFLSALKQTLEE